MGLREGVIPVALDNQALIMQRLGERLGILDHLVRVIVLEAKHLIGGAQ